MHQVGELFIEAITEVAYDPVVAEALDQGRTEDPIHLAQDMRFKAVIRGWSHQEQQPRATALLRLNDISMTREMQESHDLILLPASWWPSAIDTLDPDELGWWYRVSEPIRFKECKACGKRIGEDMPAKHRGCSKCPVGKFKHATSTQGHLCVSSDPRRVGGPGGEPTIINLKELRTLLHTQQSLEDQTVWLTTAQAGFPVTADTQEVQTDRDRLLGKPVARFLHPAISTFIQTRWQELVSTDQAPSRAEVLAKRLEETWGRAQPSARLPDDVSSKITPQEKVLWEPDPKPLMANHPPRVTDSNTRISLSEGVLTGPCPRDDSGLGWVQIQRKSLLWEEKIEGFSIITSEGLTTLAHPQLGWTITSGMWNTLRTTWGPTMATLTRIHESCKTQSLLESADVFTPTRHILQAIRRTWMVDRVHGLPAVAAPSFFPSASRNVDIWWGSQDLKTVYLWDSMDDQDKQNTMAALEESAEWTIWKTKDKRWTPLLRQAGYHQLLDIHKNKQSDCWGFKIKGWWRRGDIRATKPKKSFECWVKTAADVPTEAKKTLMKALMAPQRNAGKDEYIVDLEGNEKSYWLGTESGLIGAFGFAGACTAGDGSCDPPTRSMGAGFCNFRAMQWNTDTPLSQPLLQEQRSRESSKVGREEEGLSSNRPELVALRECLEAHEDHVDLLYLTDSEASLQAIHKWIGCGAKLNLSKSPDADILKAIILKLQKRVEAGAATLLIKVKAHRGDPLNEEADIRAELGRQKAYKETIWDDLSGRTVYQWPVKQGKTKALKTSVWTDTVRNYIRQKAGEMDAFKALKVGALKWCKEHVPRDGNDWTEEGQMLLDDPELWLDRLTFSWECHASRKRDRTTEDGTFLLHKKGAITSTFTGDWLLTEGESRDKLGEWLKKTQVRYQDQRRMLKSIMHCFPSNSWRSKITNGKESDKCDLCKALWISQGRFTTESALPVQTLGHIQHTCEALSEIHTMAHHRCWRLIHAELSRLASSAWRFICINNEKSFRTVWTELAQEFPEVFNHCAEQTLWNAARDSEMQRSLTRAEMIRRQQGISHEQIAEDRLWNKRPDGIAFKMPTDTKSGVICLLEFKRMSDVTSHYIVRAKSVAVAQYESLRSALGKAMQHSGWMVHQRSFVAGARSLNEAEFKENLEYFKVPSASIDSIRTKLAMTIFDEYANILKGMYSIRFNGRSDPRGTSTRPDTGRSDHGEAPARPARDPIPPLINSLTAWQPDKFRKRKEKGSKEKEI